MKLIRGMHNLQHQRKNSDWLSACALTIGNFDGVHAGHRAILGRVTDTARDQGITSRVMIFEPQPLEYFVGDKAPARLTTFKEKVRLLGASGIESVLCLNFNNLLRSMPAEDFIHELLVDALGVKHLFVGDDFRFGAKQQGDFQLLEKAGQDSGFRVSRTDTIKIDGERVSSTRIRSALEASDFELAERLLARPYSIPGRVLRGDRLGSQIGFPTANLSLRGKVAPLKGVYVVEVAGLDRSVDPLPGVANVGVRPTVGGEIPQLEVHLFNFNDEIYGEKIRVMFRQRLRAEVKFENLNLLRIQIQKDIQLAKEYFAASESTTDSQGLF